MQLNWATAKGMHAGVRTKIEKGHKNWVDQLDVDFSPSGRVALALMSEKTCITCDKAVKRHYLHSEVKYTGQIIKQANY